MVILEKSIVSNALKFFHKQAMCIHFQALVLISHLSAGWLVGFFFPVLKGMSLASTLGQEIICGMFLTGPTRKPFFNRG